MHRTDTVLSTAVRGQQAGWALLDRAGTAVQQRAAGLADERGAQAAEYAMLGGVSAAACGGLIAILSNTNILEKLVKAVVSSLVNVVGSWF